MTLRAGVEAAITLRSVTFAHRGAVAVCELTGLFACGSMTAIYGPNGAGKSTLLEGIAGLTQPTSGEVIIARRSCIAYLPQHAEVDRRFPIDVFDFVAFGAWPSTGAAGRVRATDRGRIEHALAQLGVADHARRPIGALSIGQFQRVRLARAIVQDADVLLLDEPFNSLDTASTTELLSGLRELHAEGRTIVAVVHDLAQIQAHFEAVLLLARRCVAWDRTSSVLNPANLARLGAFRDQAASSYPIAA